MTSQVLLAAHMPSHQLQPEAWTQVVQLWNSWQSPEIKGSLHTFPVLDSTENKRFCLIHVRSSFSSAQ